ncbi:MAG TPA: riboflavin synthase [Solimonas sp.]|nr:riboflavin synthase [Solimonas sp.]
MFTGIIEAQGRLADVNDTGGDRRIAVEAPAAFLEGVALGDSIACNGVCLTVAQLGAGSFVADVSSETLGATNAARWIAGSPLNLEKALTPSKPLGGHMVSGHVDGVGRLLEQGDDARSRRLRFEAPAALARYIARKGSICIDGVSLTVNDVEASPRPAAAGCVFGVNIVPHTLAHTTLGGLRSGDPVNLEVDLIARYLERLLESRTT